MNRILLGAGTILFVGALAISSTGAFFSDTETSTGNSFTAGAIDLKVDSTQHYDGLICDLATQTWIQDAGPVTSRPELLGTACSGTWALKDLVPTTDKFFNFTDVKPGDSGENTISLHIDNNSAYACADLSNIHNDDNTNITPEVLAGDATPGPVGDGELGQGLDFLVWNDNGVAPGHAGNNIWDADEVGTNTTGGAPLAPATYTLADGSGPAIPPTGTSYLGLAWCAGTFTAGGPGVTPVCDGSTLGNQAQTDSYTADIGIRVVQSRNNTAFRCTPPVVVGDDRPFVGALNYVAPVAPVCDITADDNGAVSAGHTSGVNAISDAITAATTGQVICVAPGTYNEFTVNKSVTIKGLSDPEGGTPAVVNPSSASVTDLALVEANNVTITGLDFDGNGTVTNGQAAGIRISPIAASLSGDTISYNVVKNISAVTGFAAKGIQWFTDTNSGFTLSNSTFANNTISNVSAVNKGGYGIQTVGAMSNVAIQNNTISNTTGAWGAGVALDTKNSTLTSVSGTTVALNQIMTGVSDGTSRFSVQVENSIDATGVGIHQNNIETSLHGGGNVALGTEGTLNAQNNWWGTAAPVIGTDVFNFPITNVTDFTSPQASAFVLN